MPGPTPNGRLLDAARHLGMRNDCVGGVRKMQVYFIDEVKSSLADNADILARDSDGRDAMDWLVELEDRTHNGAFKVAKILIDHGYPILDTEAIERMQGPLLEQVCQHLVQKERQGNGVRSQNGDNLLHVMLRNLASSMRICMGYRMGLPKLLGHDGIWIKGLNQDGLTPVHVFWSSPIDPPHPGSVQLKWLMGRMLDECGADMETLTPGGKSAIDLIQDAMESGAISKDEPGFGVLEREYIARIEQQFLRRNTSSSHAIRPSIRL